MRRALLAFLIVASSLATAPQPSEAQPSTIQAQPRVAGLDTYRKLDRLPYLEPGAEAKQFSSFARDGSNADGGTYSCLPNPGTGCLLAEDTGPGEITSIWSTRATGDVRGDVSGTGRISIVLDGVTVVNANFQDVVDGKLGAPFVYPLVGNASQLSGGVAIKVPMTYLRSMKVVVEQNPQYYHVAYRKFVDANGLTAFDPGDTALDVIDLLKAAGTKDPKPAQPGSVSTDRTVTVPANGQADVALPAGPGVISALRIRLPERSDRRLTGIRLRIAFDGRTTVDSPIGEFFGTGLGDYRVGSLLFAADPATGWFTTWWPMPYRSSVTVSLVDTSGLESAGVQVQAVTAAAAEWTEALSPTGGAGYFSTSSKNADTVPGQDSTLVDVGGRGKLVGVTQTMAGKLTDLSDWGRLYLEGDERIHVDGSPTPDIYGTGTEDFYESGWYFFRGIFSGPFVGNPAQETAAAGCQYKCDSAYRVMLADAVPYRSALRFGIEHGEVNNIAAHYASTAFLYTQPTVEVRRTDALYTGNATSRTQHVYNESAASVQGDLTSTYEGDADDVTVAAPLVSGGGAVTFRMAVDAGNRGVLLRRQSDQLVGRQAVAVSVDGVGVGTWLRPQANAVQRWAVDTFPLPAQVTAGKTAVTVKLTPLPGAPQWTASRYVADSLVTPYADLTGPAAPQVEVRGTRHAVRLAWAEPADDTAVVRYRVYGSDSPTGPKVHLATVSALNYTDGPFPVGRKRSYHVIAEDAVGNASTPSATIDTTISAATRTDTNADGRDDIIAFTRGDTADVYVSQSDGSKFVQGGERWHDEFAAGTPIPLAGDFNGDGREDIASFTRGAVGEVYVALSTGTGYGTATKWHGHFALYDEVPAVGDFNGDGKDDIVTFTRGDTADVYVSLSDGTKFVQDGWKWHDGFAIKDEIPRVGDFNGDGLDDIVTFTRGDTANVYVSQSNGSSFVQTGWQWHDYFAKDGEVPAVGDFNGDGRDDLATFTRGSAGLVYVALSDGGRFVGTGSQWHGHFALYDEVPGVGDFNGDGKDDIVTFTRAGTADVYVSRSNGSSFVDDQSKWHEYFAQFDEVPRPGLL